MINETTLKKTGEESLMFWIISVEYISKSQKDKDLSLDKGLNNFPSHETSNPTPQP